MKKISNNHKTVSYALFLIAAIVAVLAVAMIVFNITVYRGQIIYQVERGRGEFWELFGDNFVSNVLLYSLNIITVQGSIAALSTVMGVHFYNKKEATESK